MIDWCIVCGILAGLLFRTLHHNRLVVPSMAKRGFVYWVTESWVRVPIYVAIVALGSRQYGLISESYHLWWGCYFRQHSLGLWTIGIVTPTVLLYLLARITYLTHKDPHRYGMYAPGQGSPTFLRTSMRTPMVWFIVFWIWILASPWLPFRQCFVGVFLLRRPVVEVFPSDLTSPRPAADQGFALKARPC